MAISPDGMEYLCCTFSWDPSCAPWGARRSVQFAIVTVSDVASLKG